MKVFLFDIDGTLIRAGFASRRAFDTAFIEQFGTDPIREGVTFYGSTDPNIHNDIAAATLGRELTPAEHEILKRRYIELLPSEMAVETEYRILPGVEDMLSKLQPREDVALGLQTGNLEEGARIKLAHGGLDRYFSFGGFGSDSGERSEIVRMAIIRAQALLGVSAAKDVTVIGDTPQDIRAGKSCGARTVAVATGVHSIETLESGCPDAVFPDFSDEAATDFMLGR